MDIVSGELYENPDNCDMYKAVLHLENGFIFQNA